MVWLHLFNYFGASFCLQSHQSSPLVNSCNNCVLPVSAKSQGSQKGHAYVFTSPPVGLCCMPGGCIQSSMWKRVSISQHSRPVTIQPLNCFSHNKKACQNVCMHRNSAQRHICPLPNSAILKIVATQPFSHCILVSFCKSHLARSCSLFHLKYPFKVSVIQTLYLEYSSLRQQLHFRSFTIL